MVVTRPTKRVVKRRVRADLRDFLTFPSGESGREPFRSAVKGFLSSHALLPPPSSLFPHLLTWQILFRVGDYVLDDGGPAVVCLDVVEEDVARSRSVYCDHCRVVGWSSNPVSAKRYHFIIKADGNSIAGYNKTCAGCGDALHMTDSRCKSCNHVMTAEDVEDWMYQQLENTTHLLHGVIHANGYGHLLRVNGREGGSCLLSGSNIMSFWDRICTTLGVRNVSVMDVSKKRGLDFRLLHAVIKGNPWYGEWGYQFGAGSYSLTRADYEMAVRNLSFLPLSSFQSQGRKIRTRLQDMIIFYQSLSERELVNIRDLFCFLMSLINDGHTAAKKAVNSPCKKLKTLDSRALCCWTIHDINRVEEAMFKVLRAVGGSTWVSYRALRAAVFKSGTPELLEYCLKDLQGKQAALGMIVKGRISESGSMEYRLEPGSVPLQLNASLNALPIIQYPSEESLWRDLHYFYECMLHPATMVHHICPSKRSVAVDSATKILDCKQFMKNYHPEHYPSILEENALHLLCEVDLMDDSDDEYNTKPPTELLVLSHMATIADLKLEATRAFQDVYLMFRRFQAEELVGYGGVDESTQIKLLLGSAQFVQVRGSFLGKNLLGRFRMERGLERWTVDCFCGAKDDDGERMLACDVCGVWQHTRCSRILDSDAVPSKFRCHRCVQGGAQVPKSFEECVDVVVHVADEWCEPGMSLTRVL